MNINENQQFPQTEFYIISDSGPVGVKSSDLFNKYRGTNWMVEPCASCPERMIDLGGCRCQALMLTGDAANADPVCSLSPFHDRVTKITDRASREFDSNEPVPLLFRNMKNAEQFNQDKS